MGTLFGLFFYIVVLGIVILIAAIYDAGQPKKAQRYTHKDSHPGITENTLAGKKDIICPKCKSPYCMYVYEQSMTPPRMYTRTKTHLLNPFKPLVEDVTTVYLGQVITKTRYGCKNCGYVFK